jgi:hypothetical protein
MNCPKCNKEMKATELLITTHYECVNDKCDKVEIKEKTTDKSPIPMVDLSDPFDPGLFYTKAEVLQLPQVNGDLTKIEQVWQTAIICGDRIGSIEGFNAAWYDKGAHGCLGWRPRSK